jgi:hypothetical protein
MPGLLFSTGAPRNDCHSAMQRFDGEHARRLSGVL